MSLKEDLIYADYLIRKSFIKKVGFDYIYPFTTENINGYISLYDLKDKSVLTVGSSSDQILNAFVKGAKEIDSFDINPFVKYYFELKKAAIKALTLKEYETFFSYFEYSKLFSGNKNSFNIESFYKIVEYLNGDSLVFWSSLFKKYKGLTIRKNLFSFDENDITVVRKLNNYMDDNSFTFLKNNLDRLNPIFYHVDIQNISRFLSKRYDFVLLSNLANYIHLSHNNSIEEFRNNIKEFDSFINEESLILFAYLYEIDESTRIKGYWDKICQLSLVKNAFRNDNILMKSFVGVKGIIYNDDKFKDSILIYKK